MSKKLKIATNSSVIIQWTSAPVRIQLYFSHAYKQRLELPMRTKWLLTIDRKEYDNTWLNYQAKPIAQCTTGQDSVAAMYSITESNQTRPLTIDVGEVLHRAKEGAGLAGIVLRKLVHRLVQPVDSSSSSRKIGYQIAQVNSVTW
jgi:hypothetical protein